MAALLADKAYSLYRGQVQAIVSDWPARITQMQQANVSAYDVLLLLDAYRGIKTNLDAWSAVPGIKAYAQMVTTSSTYDPVAEYVNLKAAIQTAIARLTALWPQPGGFCAHESMAADGTRTPRMFTAAQLAQVASDAQAVLNTLSATP